MFYSISRKFMKKAILLLGFLCVSAFGKANAEGNAKHDELLRKSDINQATYPEPFNATAANPVNSPAISTGYYFVDSREINLPEFWRVNQEIVPLDFEPELWKRILSGPRQIDSTHWTTDKREGLAFFRNPSKPGNNSFYKHNVTYAIDSTNDAIAGPIPLGLAGGFYFNGIRCDSFYVSTNGAIALSNRRYFYDAEGNRAIPPGATDCYDPMSMDWLFAGTGVNSRARKVGALSLTDPIADDFGYKYQATGNSTTANKGIRENGVMPFQEPPANWPGLKGFDVNNKAAIIAPFWGAMQFMQWDGRWSNAPIDFSQVHYKRSRTADKLIIYIKNIQPEGGTQALAGGNYTAPTNGVMGKDANYVDASAQVVLNRLDSSITIQYERFRGSATLNVTKATYSGVQVMQALGLAGVRGFARHVNYDGTTVGVLAEYEQLTHFNKRIDPRTAAVFAPYTAVKFKQYKNVLRVNDTKYKVRNPINTADLTFNTTVADPSNYELIAGDVRLGAIQPITTIQNLTNNIQGLNGVNYTPQQLQFRARIRITNDVTNDIVYSTSIPITDSTLRDLTSYALIGEKVRWFDPFANNGAGVEKNYAISTNNGIPPYDFAQITFRPFAPSELESRFIGRLSVSVMAEPTDPVTKEALGDEWPFDDSSNTRLWVMKRITNFKDDVTEFHYLGGLTVPSVLKWVNLGAIAVSADDNSLYPVAPRGRYQEATKNEELFQFLNSPAILMDRTNDEAGGDWVEGNPPDPKLPAGDEIRSFPIDLNGKVNPVLSLSIQRSIQNNQTLRGRGFCDQTLFGPEPRVVINDENRTYPEFKGTTSPYGTATNMARFNNDEIRIEFAYPSIDGVKNVTNMEDANWRKHMDNTGSLVQNASAYALYGGGGFRLGFDEDDKNDALTPAEGIRTDIYDDGFDWDYKKIFIPIPDYINNAPEAMKKNFRFRIQVRCVNHFTAHQSIQQNTIGDDSDPFLVDNISIISNPKEADLEVASVKVKWPYTAIPASQALNVPITVKISNNTGTNSKAFVIRTWVTDPSGVTVYCRNINIPVLAAKVDTVQEMPAWNARSNRPGTYRIHSRMHYVGNTTNMMDLDTTNDYNYSDFDLKFADSFTYENDTDPTMATNDVPKFLNTSNRGLNLRGYRMGGIGSTTGWSDEMLFSDYVHSGGAIGGDASGQIAVKFTLAQPDTLFGYQAFFASYNMDQSRIMFRVYNSSPDGSLPSQTVVEGSEVIKTRAVDDITNQFTINKYVTYQLPTPLLLPSGTYWMAIGQLGVNGLELGAKAERMGFRTTLTFVDALTDVLGEDCVNLLVDKNLRQLDRNGKLVNNNIFAYENIIGTNDWNQFMPTNSNPAYPHLDHYGLTPVNVPVRTYTATRGTWLPMLRPYFGVKKYGEESISVECPAPEGFPIELTEFDAQQRNNGVEIFWATATEKNNKGFYVEKATEGSLDFKAIAFVEGKVNSIVANEYNHFDKDVENNKTYTYRLRQVDVDGSNCDTYSQDVKVKFTFNGDVVLESNAPNPFSTSTKISFRLATPADVKLEVLDMFGSVIRTLVNGNLKAERHSYEWTGATESGSTVAPGTYVYRLTVGDKVLHGKMSIVR